MNPYDIHFIGHLCIDETLHADATRSKTFGGAALYGAIAAATLGGRISLELKLADPDSQAIQLLRDRGVKVFPIPAGETTQVEVSHPSGKMDERKIVTTHFAEPFDEKEIHLPDARHVHLAGCNDHEFSLEFIQAIRAKAASLSIDMQCLVRTNDPQTGEMTFADDPNKKQIVSMMDKIKFDVMEAGVFCGTEDPNEAAKIIQSWGCPEVMITRADGVFLRCGNETGFQKFTNTGLAGRTGRGDTTFGTYLGARIDHDPPEALKYAAALVSLKMETPGPFGGTLQDVRDRIRLAESLDHSL